MKFKKEYEKFAQSVIQLNKMTVDTSCNELEAQENNLFYWIMKQIMWHGPQMIVGKITLSAVKLEYNNRVRVQCGREGEIWSNPNLTPEEFFNVMKNMADLFNSIPNYNATYLYEEGSNVALLTIFVNSLN